VYRAQNVNATRGLEKNERNASMRALLAAQRWAPGSADRPAGAWALRLAVASTKGACNSSMLQ
jgi:hypothetical protein